MRQDQEIAAAQAFADYVATDIDYQTTLSEHSDILVKGNSGVALDEVEQHKLRILMQGAEDRIYQHGVAVQPLGLGVGRSERRFASFLYRNPVARATWLQIGEEMERYVDPLLTPNSLANSRKIGYIAFRDRINAYLAKLDDLYKSSP
jgi:hypothetical protein